MRQRSAVSMAVMAMWLPVAVGAADSGESKPKAAVPADFLEYLAALEGSDHNWTDVAVVDGQPPLKNRKPAAPEAAMATEPE
jgi:hypothetical protein